MTITQVADCNQVLTVDQSIPITPLNIELIDKIGNFYISTKDYFIENLTKQFSESGFMKVREKLKSVKNISILNIHPFSILYSETNMGGGIFPSISVSVVSQDMTDPTLMFDFDSGYAPQILTEAFLNDIKSKESLVPKSTIQMIEELNKKEQLYYDINKNRLKERVVFDVWDINIKVKDFLFDCLHIVLFDLLEDLRNRGVDNIQISGNKDGEYNMDYAQVLYGSNITMLLTNTYYLIRFYRKAR